MRKVYLIAALLWSGVALCENERYHQGKYCAGIVEHRLKDRTRVDCLTPTHAIEYDFARKWAEAIGQSLHYARMTGKAAGIVIIYKGSKDDRYMTRLNGVIDKYNLPVTVWRVEYIGGEPMK